MQFSVAPSGLAILTVWPTVGYACRCAAALTHGCVLARLRRLTPARFGGDAKCGQGNLYFRGAAMHAEKISGEAAKEHRRG